MNLRSSGITSVHNTLLVSLLGSSLSWKQLLIIFNIAFQGYHYPEEYIATQGKRLLYERNILANEYCFELATERHSKSSNKPLIIKPFSFDKTYFFQTITRSRS